MSSDITTTTINALYPVAGQDNDSAGFRNNFGAIKTALQVAKVEIEELQNKAVLKSSIGDTATAVTSDLGEGVILNGGYNKFYGVRSTYSQSLTDTGDNILEASLYNGVFQLFSVARASTLRFSNWPVNARGVYASIRVHLIGLGVSSHELTAISSANAGVVIREASFPAIEIDNSAYHAIEAYTYDGGATVFVKYLGRYAIP
jgi:hypothetical protein